MPLILLDNGTKEVVKCLGYCSSGKTKRCCNNCRNKSGEIIGKYAYQNNIEVNNDFDDIINFTKERSYSILREVEMNLY